MTCRFVPHPHRRQRFRSAAAIVALLAAAALQGGCEAAVGTTTSTAGKNPLDRVYSWATGKDCAMVRPRSGASYCVEDEVAVPVTAHCYPTLGEITCYTAADPYPGRQREMGSVPVAQLSAAPKAAGVHLPAPPPAAVAPGTPPATPPGTETASR